MAKTASFKKTVAFLVTIVMICAAFGAVAFLGQTPAAEVNAAEKETVITLQIGIRPCLWASRRQKLTRDAALCLSW